MMSDLHARTPGSSVIISEYRPGGASPKKSARRNCEGFWASPQLNAPLHSEPIADEGFVARWGSEIDQDSDPLLFNPERRRLCESRRLHSAY